MQRKCHRNVKEGKAESIHHTSKDCFGANVKDLEKVHSTGQTQQLSVASRFPLDELPVPLAASPAGKLADACSGGLHCWLFPAPGGALCLMVVTAAPRPMPTWGPPASQSPVYPPHPSVSSSKRPRGCSCVPVHSALTRRTPAC